MHHESGSCQTTQLLHEQLGNDAIVVQLEGERMFETAALFGKHRDPVRVRLAQSSDAEFLWRLANDTREWSFSDDPISWEDHLRWFTGVLDDTSRTLIVGADDSGERVGFVRFDLESRGFLVSIALTKDRRGVGIGRQLLDSAITFHGPGTYIAEVRPDNIASLSLFRHWRETAMDSGRRRFELEATAPQEPRRDAGS